MANINITGLPNLSPLNDAALLPTDSGGTTYHVSAATLKAYTNSTAGNITANYFIGNGSALTNLPIQYGTYGNSNVAMFLGDFGSNTISTAGNIVTGASIVNGNSSVTGNIVTGPSIVNGNSNVTGNFNHNGLYISPPNFVSISGSGIVNLSATTSFNILYLNAAGYTVTLNAPTLPVNGQQCSFSIINATVTLAVGTGTFVPTFAGAPTAGLSYQYTYHSATDTWYVF